MNIYISDIGIYKSDSSLYPSATNSPVNKIDSLKKTVSSTDSVAREAQKAYVAENTPAYNISISSMGRAAIQSMKGLSNNFASNMSATNSKDSININESNTDNKDITISIYDSDTDIINNSGLSVDSNSESENSIGIIANNESDEESTEITVTTGSLAKYSGYQLQQLLNDGSITRAQYNTEMSKRTESEASDQNNESAAFMQLLQDPVLKQAIDAYNFQMSYQINTMLTQ